MPGFVKPTRKVVNIEDAFGELIGKKLIKDLHDNEEICPVCHGIGLRIEDNPYDDIGADAVAEMQRYLDEWKKKYGRTSYLLTTKHAIRIPWEEMK